MQKAVLRVDTLNVTQKMNGSFSHQGTLALDIGSACKWLQAPFTGIIKRKYASCNAVWLQSKEKVKYADGTEDYMTLLVMHDNDISNLKVGQEIKQGTNFYQPGVKGYATGSHIHITVGKGKFSGTGWYQNSYGQWCINNQYDITKALFLSNLVKVSNNGGYKWTISNNTEYNPNTTRYLNLKPDVEKWSVYSKLLGGKLLPIYRKGYVKPKKYKGLSYKILKDNGNGHYEIQTSSYGRVHIAGDTKKYSCTITSKPTYKNGNY